ncbi:hypothetical protein [uncultured Tenacibaculum sp.]|uniref:Ig-like domain-containing protein n=1 Tax=uncultured Tenacibaculum sp. TaxID=174713 RepID=UPI00262F92CC|nr:hypothetical protein [uncultured Tenacibaculum sp.]
MKKITTLFALIFLIQFTSCSKDDAVINTAPIIKAQAFEVFQNAIITLKIVATDLEDDSLTFSIKKDESNLFTISSDGTLRVQAGKTTPPKTYLIDVEVSDGNSKSSATMTLVVKPVAMEV